MSQFAFLEGEWPEIAQAAKRAEGLARSDAPAACFYARRSIELAVAWLYRNDPALRLPYQDSQPQGQRTLAFEAEMFSVPFLEFRIHRLPGHWLLLAGDVAANRVFRGPLRCCCPL